MPNLWEIIGGAEKGGILVRAGESTSAQQEDARLSTGALVEEVELTGDRLHYQLLEGQGPREGWVSIKLKDKELVAPLPEAAAAPADPAEWPARLKAALAAGPVVSTLKEAAPWMGSVGKAAVERSDVCAVPAAGVIAEAMVALTLADAVLEKFGGDSVRELRRNLEGYVAHLNERGFGER